MTLSVAASSDGMLTALRMTPPLSTSTICSAISMPTASWASAVEAPKCGVSVTFGSERSSLSLASGSVSKTSRPAAATWPDLSAAMSAASLIMPPRAQLKSFTPFRHFASATSSIMYWVCSVNGMCTVM